MEKMTSYAKTMRTICLKSQSNAGECTAVNYILFLSTAVTYKIKDLYSELVYAAEMSL